MFSRLFMVVGGIFLAIYNFFKEFSIENAKPSLKRKKEIDSSIFSKLNLKSEVSNKSVKKDSKISEIRNIIMPYLLDKKVILALMLIFVLMLLFVNLELAGMYFVIVLMAYVFIFYYPQLADERSYMDLNQELPYALRHMGIELKSGKGLHDSLITIKDSDYGSLSKEFNRVLEEVKYGKTTEDSLLEMSHRVQSEGLSRCVQQIIGTLRVGGNLASSLEIIAKDISFDMQIKLKEYSQKLNAFILIYTFLAILAPVICLIMLMAASTVMGDLIHASIVLVIYSLFFPMVVVFMGVFIKKLEPKI